MRYTWTSLSLLLCWRWGGCQQNAWPEFNHYRKYKNKERDRDFKPTLTGLTKKKNTVDDDTRVYERIQGQTPWSSSGSHVETSEWLHVCVCIWVWRVCVNCFILKVFNSMYVWCVLCVRVRTNSINIKKSDTFSWRNSLVKETLAEKRAKCWQCDCLDQAFFFFPPGVYCVFYITCVTLSNTAH